MRRANKNSSLRIPILAAAAISTAAIVASTPLALSSEKAPSKNVVAKKPLLADEIANNFAATTANIGNSLECLPVYADRHGVINILYQYCSDTAQQRELQPHPLQGTFQVTPTLSARFHFWRRIYSLWSSDQYVLHVGAFPEVVLEIADASQAGIEYTSREKERMVKLLMKEHRRDYRQILHNMHRMRNKPMTDFSPTMARIARSMAHISDPNKYLKAAESIRLQRGQRDFIANGLSVSTRYLPAIREEFIREGVPVELANLAFIESSFNIQAYSKVGAAGVYQIMPATGKQYMKVTDSIDERRDPIKSARAAAKLLKLYHGITGNWPLAITAYNHGVGGIRQAVRSTGSSNIDDLVQRYEGKAFGFASKNFYSGFLALLSTLENAKAIFPEVVLQEPMRFKSVRLAKDMNIQEIQREFNVTRATIADFNPDISRSYIRQNGTLPRRYELKIPTSEDYSVDVKLVPALR